MTARRFTITDEQIRRYSRRGNYHSEATTAAELGLPGLVAQGTQATGPAYGVLLDEWGDEFLAHGEIDVRFVGMVLAGHTVEAGVTFEPGADRDRARVEVRNLDAEATAVVGHARRRRG